MINLNLTKAQMLKEVDASDRALANRFSDPASRALITLEEASFVILGTTARELWPILEDVLSKRFTHVPAEQLFSDLLFPVKKGLGNAHNWGNRGDAAKHIRVELVVTRTGAVVSVSDEGSGFDPAAILSKMERAESYFTDGGAGFHQFAKTRSLVSYADGGRTLLICYRCEPDTGQAGVHARTGSSQTQLATASTLARARVCLVSYPMSGSTWLRASIGKALCEKHGLDDSHIFHERRLTKHAGVLRTAYIDGDAELARMERDDDVEEHLSLYRSKKVILLVRDPRDLVLSCYRAQERAGTSNGSISDFIRGDHGIQRIVTFYDIWYANRHVPEEFLPVGYDALHTDPSGILRRVLSVIDPQPFSEEIINRAVDYGNDEEVRAAEESGGPHVGDLKQEDRDYLTGVLAASISVLAALHPLLLARIDPVS